MLLTRYEKVLVEVIKFDGLFLMKEVGGSRRWFVTKKFGVDEVKVEEIEEA